jgi:hypothetical protein
LVNLEVLWVNNNQLQCITNLDSNFRIKKLYAQVGSSSRAGAGEALVTYPDAGLSMQGCSLCMAMASGGWLKQNQSIAVTVLHYPDWIIQSTQDDILYV